MKIMIPPELKRRVMKRTIIRLSLFVGILLVLVLVFVGPFAELERNNKILTFYVVAVLDGAATGVPFKVMRRRWQGEVVSVGVRTGTKSWSHTKPTQETWDTINTVVLTLKTPKGKTIAQDAESVKAQHSQVTINRYEKVITWHELTR